MLEFFGSPQRILPKAAYACMMASPPIAGLTLLLGWLRSDGSLPRAALPLLRELILGTGLLISVAFIVALLFVLPVIAVLRKFEIAGPSTILCVVCLPSFFVLDIYRPDVWLVLFLFGCAFGYFFNRRTRRDD